MNELVLRELRAADMTPRARFDVLEAISATLFEYMYWISQQVVVYEDERERWLENQNSIRACASAT
jgi:hypothetical protein